MLRVIKIGGSILLRNNLAATVHQWLDAHPADETMVIIGGGKLIDAVRELDQQHTMSPQQTHWMCVDLLTATASFAAEIFGWPLVATEQEWNVAIEQSKTLPKPHGPAVPTVITPNVFYNRKNSKNKNILDMRVPTDWRTTTDTIAALLAHRIDADELVLLKSCPIVSKMSFTKLAEAGIVDEAFPEIATGLKTIRVEQLK